MILIACESNQSNIERTNTNLQNDLLGKYRLSTSAYGIILNLKDSINIDYLTWRDIGGYFFGRKGNYQIKKDTMFLNLFHPICRDTHYVRFDTLLIEKWRNHIIFKHTFIEDDWDVEIDNKTNIVVRGHDCFVKVAEINENYYESIEIGEWDTLINKNSFPIRFPYPPLPPRPEIPSEEIEPNGFYNNY